MKSLFFRTVFFVLITASLSAQVINAPVYQGPVAEGYLRQWQWSTNISTNYYYNDELEVTNKLVTTNTSHAAIPFQWELTQYYTVTATNTNILQTYNTNLQITVQSTNVEIRKTNMIYLFRDGFDDILFPRQVDSYRELQEDLLDFLLPGYTYQFETSEGWIKKKIRLKNTIFTTDEAYAGFDMAYWDYLLYKSKDNRIKFTAEEQKHLTIGFEEWDTKVVIRGNIDLKVGYGLTFKDENNPVSLAIQDDFRISQLMKVNVTGWFGERIKVNIDQDSQRESNKYDIGFTALKKDDNLLRELKVGNISLNIPPSSHYLKYSGTTEDSIGIKAVLERNAFSWQTVLNITKTQKGYKKFTGNSQFLDLDIMDTSFLRRRFFVLPDTGIDLGSLSVYQFTTSTNTADRRIDDLYYDKLDEGQDYFVNLSTGELDLVNSLNRDQNLLVTYTHAASFISTNTNDIIGVDNDNNEHLLYLWKADMNFSPHVHYGVFNLTTTDFDPSQGFSIQVYESEDLTTLSAVQFTAADYELNTIQGMLRFNSRTPFPDTELKIYYGADDPTSSDSKNTMNVELYKKLRNYRLDFGVIPNTERVFVNGRELESYEYQIIYALGDLLFSNPALINENDVIEVYYEYQPFFNTTQRFGIASRLDYKPSNKFNIGTTILYGVNQRPAGGAPYIYQTPDGSFMADLDSSVNLSKILGMNDDWVLSVKGEYALSLLDKNTAGYAIVDDFETAGSRFTMSINENRWILASPSSNISGISYANRGHLLYKDYRDYNLDNSYTILTYDSTLTSEKLLSYGTKPGPYLVLGGHLNASDYPQVSQSALVFDYDFSAGSWVGAAINITGPSGQDFTRYNTLQIWYKVESDDDGDGIFVDTGSQQVDIFVGLGQPNEDSDGDGVFDGEVDRSQAGYAFNDFTTPSLVNTWVGAGRQGGGDGFIQTEDLNRDKAMQTNDSIVIFPSSQGYTDATNATLSEGGWQLLNIRISSLPDAQKDILEHASALVIYIKQRNGTRGRVIVDELQFKEVKWEDKRVDGIKISDSTAMEGELLGVYDNSFYSANRFYDASSSDEAVLERATLFEQLHGTRTISEALQYNEFTLKLDYDLSNQAIITNTFPVRGGKKASLIQYATEPFDISLYKEFNFYVYIPDVEENSSPLKQSGDTYTNEDFFFILGNSDQSFYEWQVPMDNITKNTWHRFHVNIEENLSLHIDGTNQGSYRYPAQNGLPNLNDISYLEIGVEVTSTNEPLNRGTVWINEIHVHNDTSVLGTAWYVNPRFEYKKPVWKSGRTEIIGPLYLNSTFEQKSTDFVNSIGGSTGNLNDNVNVNFRSSFFKDLKYTLSYTRNIQSTETNEIELPLYLQWDSAHDSFNSTISFTHKKKWVPVFNHTFTESFYYKLSRSQALTDTNEYILNTQDKQYKGTASVNYTHILPFSAKYSVTPSITIEDTVSIRDYANYSNDQVFFTNNSVLANRSENKRWLAGLTLNLSKFKFTSSYEKRHEKQDLLHDVNGLRTELQELEALSIGERYLQRLAGIGQGFDFQTSLDKQLEDRVTLGLSVNRPLPWLVLSTLESFSRIQNGYTYDYANNLTYRNDKYNMRNAWNLRLSPRKFLFKNLNLKFDRSVDLSYSSLSARIESEDALVMGNIYYYQPFHYSGFLGGNNSLTNALFAVNQFSGGIYESINTLSDQFTAELILPDYKSDLLNFLPKRYTFSSRLYTSRNRDSYSQTIENRANARFPIPLKAMVKKSAKVQMRDIDADVDYRFTHNLNERKQLDTLGITLRHGMNLINSNFTRFTYSYSFRYEFEDYITNSLVHSQLYGFDSTLPNVSPKSSLYNTVSFRAIWEVKNIKRLNLIFTTIKLKDSSVRHTEHVSFTSQHILYDGSAFVAFDQKLYEVLLEHTTDYKFTEVFSGVFRLKGIINQYATVTPISSSAQGFTRTVYDPGLGFDVALDLKIKI